MQAIMDRFNRFFEGSAQAEIDGERLRITIGTQTLIIQLPSIVRGEGRSKD